jgi:hypothetical protein
MAKFRSLWKGVAVGIAGGLAASFAMDQFQSLLGKLAQNGAQHSRSAEKPPSPEDRPATVKAAEAVSIRLLGRPPMNDEIAGNLAHYVMGAASGALYAILAETTPLADCACAGPAFGAALWLTADEIAVPALGLSKGPWHYPASSHLSALAAHLVYGLALDLSHRGFARLG